MLDSTRLELHPYPKRGFPRCYRSARWLGLAALLASTACGGKSRSDTDAVARATSHGGGEAATGGSSAAGGSSPAEGGSPAMAGSAEVGDEGGAAGNRAVSGDGGAGGDSPACLPGLVPDGHNFSCTAPSCLGLAKTCGPNGTADCCASPLVSGTGSVAFYRSYDGLTFTSQADPAQVSDFRLDTYEITVGRFRNFLNAYSQTMTPEGAGKNPNNPSDTGWSSAWNTNLDANKAALAQALQCLAPFQTWIDQAGSAEAESLPINCLNWYEAEAFCIWDGGRLPTEAEWNYAAAGGTEQRVYPWGSAAPDCSFANYSGAAGDNEFCVQPPNGATNRVGSESPQGDGRFGQADLAGNVWEWAQDFHAAHYPTPCRDCANLTAAPARALRGGGLFDGHLGLRVSFRSNSPPLEHDVELGARCARDL